MKVSRRATPRAASQSVVLSCWVEYSQSIGGAIAVGAIAGPALEFELHGGSGDGARIRVLVGEQLGR
jgi:hypothetical protein